MTDINTDPTGRPAGTRTWWLTLMAAIPGSLAFCLGAWNENEGVMAASTAMFATGIGFYVSSRHMHKKQLKGNSNE